MNNKPVLNSVVSLYLCVKPDNHALTDVKVDFFHFLFIVAFFILHLADFFCVYDLFAPKRKTQKGEARDINKKERI